MFLHTKANLQDRDVYFLAQLPNHYSKTEEIGAPKNGLPNIKAHIWPLYEDGLRICSHPDRPDIYVKKSQPTGYLDSPATSINLQEAKLCGSLVKIHMKLLPAITNAWSKMAKPPDFNL